MLVAGVIHIINIAFLPSPLKNGTNFPKQLLLKLPTQRPSSLPWGPRPGPIEHLNIFFILFYHQHKFTALFFSPHSTNTAHICWRWAALPFADQTFRFRTPDLLLVWECFTTSLTMTIITLWKIIKDEANATTTTGFLPFERNRENIGLYYLEALTEASG